MLRLTGITYKGYYRGPWDVPDDIVKILNKIVEKYSLPPGLIYGICAGESSFDTKAWNKVPPDNSIGLFQWNISPNANPQYTYNQLIDPVFNAEITGKWMKDHYDGKDWHTAAPERQWGASPLAFMLWEQWGKDGSLEKIAATAGVSSGGNSGGHDIPPVTVPVNDDGSGTGRNVPLVPIENTTQKKSGMNLAVLGFLGIMIVAYMIHENNSDSPY